MDYVFLGNSGVRVSSVGFGTMSFGGDADAQTSQKMFAQCMDAGVNFFDCADVYNGGEAERLLGRFSRQHRDELILTTKAYFPTSAGPNDRGSSARHLKMAVSASLKRLRTDRIDVFFLHRWDDKTPIEQTVEALAQMVAQGKIIYVGVSNFSAWQSMKTQMLCRQAGVPLIVTQPMYNLLKRQAEVEILPMAQAEGLGVTPYSPLAGGLLTGKYVAEESGGRIRSNKMYKVRYGAQSNFEIAERFVTLAKEHCVHPVTMAVAWVAAQEAVTAPLLGARSSAQLEPALAAAGFTMSHELREQISALSPKPPPATDRNEEKSAHNFGAR